MPKGEVCAVGVFAGLGWTVPKSVRGLGVRPLARLEHPAISGLPSNAPQPSGAGTPKGGSHVSDGTRS